MANNDKSATNVVSNTTVRPGTGHLAMDGLLTEGMIKGGVNKPAVIAKPSAPPGQGQTPQATQATQAAQAAAAHAANKPAGK